MAQRIFIPVFEQPYVLAEPAEISLYPGNNTNWKVGGMRSVSFYAHYRKAEGFTAPYAVRFVEYTNDYENEANDRIRYSHKYNERMVSCFIVTDTVLPESVQKKLGTPRDLFDLNLGNVYAVFESNEYKDTASYSVFVPAGCGVGNHDQRPSYPKPPRFCKELPEVNEAHVEIARQHSLRAWEAAQSLNPVIELMKTKCVPVNYTVPAGTTFKVVEGIKPFDKDRRSIGIELDGVKFTLFTQELSKFVLDEVEVSLPPGKRKKATKTA